MFRCIPHLQGSDWDGPVVPLLAPRMLLTAWSGCQCGSAWSRCKTLSFRRCANSFPNSTPFCAPRGYREKCDRPLVYPRDDSAYRLWPIRIEVAPGQPRTPARFIRGENTILLIRVARSLYSIGIPRGLYGVLRLDGSNDKIPAELRVPLHEPEFCRCRDPERGRARR